MSRLRTWIAARNLGCVGLLALCIGLLVGITYWTERADDAKCANIMASARTSRDTMDAKIACEQIHAATSQAISTGVAAGVVAGAVAGSAASSPSRR